MAPKPRLLEQVCERLRLKHYSIRTEQAYLDWIKRYILFHGKRHPVSIVNPMREPAPSWWAPTRKGERDIEGSAMTRRPWVLIHRYVGRFREGTIAQSASRGVRQFADLFLSALGDGTLSAVWSDGRQIIHHPEVSNKSKESWSGTQMLMATRLDAQGRLGPEIPLHKDMCSCCMPHSVAADKAVIEPMSRVFERSFALGAHAVRISVNLPWPDCKSRRRIAVQTSV